MYLSFCSWEWPVLHVSLNWGGPDVTKLLSIFYLSCVSIFTLVACQEVGFCIISVSWCSATQNTHRTYLRLKFVTHNSSRCHFHSKNCKYQLLGCYWRATPWRQICKKRLSHSAMLFSINLPPVPFKIKARKIWQWHHNLGKIATETAPSCQSPVFKLPVWMEALGWSEMGGEGRPWLRNAGACWGGCSKC